MIIAKKQKDKKNFRLNWSYFKAAREGLRHILNLENGMRRRKILIPAYVGYSPREGSGVFDPIREAGTDYDFYKIGPNVNIDTDDILEKIKLNQGEILFLIHYFGFKDKNLNRIKSFAKCYDMLIIEDFAHAFFTFWLNPVIDFDYAIFSIHKLFPLNSGGIVLSRRPIKERKSPQYDLFRFNMKAIAEKRIENYNFILDKLRRQDRLCKIVNEKLDKNTVPQTFPILLKNARVRDLLYFKLNEKGYGVISLYNHLVNQVPRSFSGEYSLAERILNLPVHQDVEKKDLNLMINIMLKLIKNANGSK